MMIQADNGEMMEIYRNKIEQLASEFAADKTDEQMQEPQVFTALLNFIYRNLFAPTEANIHIYNANRGAARQNSILNYNHLPTLDSIWNAYLDLTVQYNQIPTLLDYSVMTGIDKDTLTTWADGSVRNKTDAYMRTIKRWKETCETALAKRAIMSNSIGAIFALKSCHNWKEATSEPSAAYIPTTRESPEEIQERYKNAKRPTLPKMDD